VTAGDEQGISADLQTGAMAVIPPGSTYALLLPTDQAAGTRIYGIQPVTFATTGPYLFYELLPSVPASPATARYIICWGCDTTPWDGRTTWLYTDPHGVAIGRVRGR
jgi:hypothetical protein